MSQENVEAVKAWIGALNRRDLSALLVLADPSLEYRSYLASLSGERLRIAATEVSGNSSVTSGKRGNGSQSMSMSTATSATAS